MSRNHPQRANRRPSVGSRAPWAWSDRRPATIPRLECLEDRTLPNASAFADWVTEAKQDYRHLDAGLLNLVQPAAARIASPPDIGASTDSMMFRADGRVQVQITARDVDQLLPALESMGFQPVASHPELHFVDGWLPMSALLPVSQSALDGLLGISPVYRPQASVGLVTSQADLTLQAARVRATLPPGVDGTGIKVGVLSDSFNNLGGAASDIASNDLPAGGVTVLQDLGSGGSDEGRAMLQLIHDLAPGATLGFATAFNGEAAFAQRIRDLANPAIFGANIIVDDVFYFSEPFFQDGVVAQAIDNVVANNGVAYFSSAGNLQDQSYESSTVSFTTTTVSAVSPSPMPYFDFDPGPGIDVRQRITIGAGQNIDFGLQWDQPFFTVNGVTTDVDIFLLNGSTGAVVASAIDDNVAFQRPLENLSFTNGTGQTQFDVVIQIASGPNVGRLKYVNFGSNGSGPITFNEFGTNSSTITPHSASLNAMSVAAAAFTNQRSPEDFTSKGPVTILFSPTGTPLGPQVRAKPDFTATDGGDTTFFGSDTDGNGFKNFFGTSAAAPHAAAVAALLKQAQPSFTPAQIYAALLASADPNIGGTPGDVNFVGAGLIDAYRAIIGQPVPAALNLTEGFESGVLGRAWEVYNSVAGRTLVRNTGTPAAGSFHLTMDGLLDGFAPDVLSEAILHVNATGLTNVMLTFKEKEFNDTDQAMPASFSGHGNFDGVSLSVNGVNWVRIVSLTGASSTSSYQTQTFNLSTIATANGLTLGADVRVKFQHFSSSSFFIPSEGLTFDDVSVTGTSAGDVTPPQVTARAPLAGSTITVASVNIDVTFSEAVVGVDATDLVLSGAAAAGAVVGTTTNLGSNTFRFPVSGLVNGALNVSLAPDANDLEDAAGNDLSPRPTTWSYTVAIPVAPALSAIEAGALAYTENGAAAFVTTTLSVVDADSANLASATVAITANYANGQDVLSFTDQSGITGSFDASTGVLTLTGSATVANYQTALRAVRYQNTSDNPTTSARTLSFQVSDGGLSSNILTRSIAVAAVNDAPSLAGIEAAALAFTENGAATVVTSTLAPTDVDNTNLASATVAITANYANGQDVLSFTDQSGITGSFNASTGVLTLTGSATVANYQTALRAVRYQNASENPSTLTRTLSFQVSDGGLSSNTLTRSVTVAAVNDAPLLAGIEAAALAFTENGASTVVTSTLAPADVDNTNLASATVSIAGNYANGQDVLSFTDQSGITGSFNASTGVLTLSGSATAANYQSALRAVRYQNTSDNPSTLTRTLSFQVSDGALSSNILTRSVTVAAVNDAPSLAGIEVAALAFTENGAATVVTATLSAADVDNANLASATVAITANYVNGQDALSFTDQSGITGSFNASTGVLILTGSATVANYQTALRAVRYQNTSDNPTTLTRTLSFQVSDGALSSNVLTRSVTVAAVNDAPTLAGIEPVAFSFTENDAAIIVTSILSLADVDNTNLAGATVAITANYANGQDVLTFTNQSGITGSFNASTGVLTLTGSATVANYQAALRALRYQNTSDNPTTLARTLSFQVSDGALSSNILTRSVTIAAVNDAPTLAGIEPAALSFTENDAATVATTALSPADVDNANLASATVSITANYANGQDALSFTDQSGITGSFNASTGVMTLSGSATLANYQAALRAVRYQNTSDNPTTLARTLSFQVSDGALSSNILTRSVTVAAVNDAPTLAGIEPVALSFTENDAATTVTATLSTFDVDNTNLAGATVAITANYANGQDVLTFTNQSGITGSFNASLGVLTLTGSATVASYQAALRTVRYQNTSDNPTTLARTILFQVSDGAMLTNMLTRGVTVAAVNDAPTLAAIEPVALSFTENDAATVATATLTPADVDNANLAGATVAIAANYANGQDVLSFTTQSGITGSFNASTGVLTLSGSATLSSYQAALRTVRYQNTSDNPSTLARTLSFQVSDGGLSSNILTRSLAIAAVNDAPTLSGIEPVALSFTENDTATVATSTLAPADMDNANLAGATVAITGNYANGQDVLSFSDQSGISGSFNASTGVLTLTGSATLANYQTALRAVRYLNTSDNPSTAARTLAYQVSDGALSSNTLTRGVTVAAVNDPPVLASIEPLSLSFIENDPATILTTTVTAADVDSANLTGATVTVSGNFAAGQDVLNFNDQLGISGSFNVTTGVLTLTGAASVTDYQTALRAVRWQNLSDDPSTLPRTLSFQVSDGALPSNLLMRSISVAGVNDAPMQSNIESGALTFTENGPPTAVSSAVAPTDVDNANLAGATVTISGNYANGQDVLTFTNQLGIAGSFNAATGALTLTGSASLADYQTALRAVRYQNASDNPSTLPRTLSFQVSDGILPSNVLNRSLVVVEVNDPPTGANDSLASAAEDSGPLIISFLSLLANDTTGPASESGQALTIASVQNATGGTATIVGTTVRFSLAPDFNGAAGFSYTLQDNGTTNGALDPKTSTAAVSFTVTAVNDVPSFTKGVDVNILEDAGPQILATWAKNISKGPADESAQSLTYLVSNDNAALFAVPPAVSADGTLTFTAAANAFGNATVTLRLRDTGGLANGGLDTSAFQSFAIAVAAVNDAPERLSGVLQDLTVAEDAGTVSLSLGALTYGPGGGPSESGQALTVIVTAVPTTTLGDIVLADGVTRVLPGTFTIAQLRGMRFRTFQNAFGASSFSFSVKDDGGTVNGGKDSLAQSLAITVARLDDDKGTLSIRADKVAVNEGQDLVVTITRSGGSEGAISVQFTLSAPVDAEQKRTGTVGIDTRQVVSNVVNFAAGETQKTIAISTLTDNLVEDAESVIVTLQNPTGGAALGSSPSSAVSIVDGNLPLVPDETPNLPTLQRAGSGFGKSEEHYRDFVTKAYRRFLDRLPDEQGLTFWVTLMQRYETSNHTQGLRQEQIEAGFIDSAEYLGRFGGVGERWIRGIYRDLLDRDADAAGLRFWLDALAGGVSPTQVALGFTTSLERLQNRIEDTYQTLLGRAADAPGLAFWVAIFQAGGTTEDINSGFVGSPEYYAKVDGAAGNPAKWVREAYLDILFRPARVDELAFWLAFLKA